MIVSVCQSHIIYNFILVWHDISNSKGIIDKLNRYAEQTALLLIKFFTQSETFSQKVSIIEYNKFNLTHHEDE